MEILIGISSRHPFIAALFLFAAAYIIVITASWTLYRNRKSG